MSPSIDIMIPVYGEAGPALRATTTACLSQLANVHKVWVIDDGSPTPIHRDDLPSDYRVTLERLEMNSGISAARMHALSRSEATFVACVNVDVLPAPGWALQCADYLGRNPEVGAVYTSLVPSEPTRMLSRWRMRFHEQKYDRPAGPAPFAPGHAVLFRRAAIMAVGGYDLKRRRVGEDSDICERMRQAGWETHYLPDPPCMSIQSDTLAYLARKQLIRDGFDPSSGTFDGVLGRSTRMFGIRVIRNLAKGRIGFIPIDAAIWAVGTWILMHAAKDAARMRSAGREQADMARK